MDFKVRWMYLHQIVFYTGLTQYIPLSFLCGRVYDVGITNNQRFNVQHHRRCNLVVSTQFLSSGKERRPME